MFFNEKLRFQFLFGKYYKNFTKKKKIKYQRNIWPGTLKNTISLKFCWVIDDVFCLREYSSKII